MREYEKIARCVVDTDRDLARQLIAMLHRLAQLPLNADPGVERAQNLQAALRYALAERAPEELLAVSADQA